MSVEAAEALLNIRDEVAVAKHLVVAMFLASQAPTLPSGERHALCTVANAARERLEAVEVQLDQLILGGIV